MGDGRGEITCSHPRLTLNRLELSLSHEDAPLRMAMTVPAGSRRKDGIRADTAGGSAAYGRIRSPCCAQSCSIGCDAGVGLRVTIRLCAANPLPATRNPQTTVNRPIAIIALAALMQSNGCRSDPVFVEMSDSTFVRTMVALRKLPIGSADTTTRARQRDSVLRVFGVTAAQVESTTLRLANDPARAAAIWRAIENPSTGSPP